MAKAKKREWHCPLYGTQENCPEVKKCVDVLKLAYRKHHLGDADIGWEELDNSLRDVLCGILSDEGYREWLRSLEGGD